MAAVITVNGGKYTGTEVITIQGTNGPVQETIGVSGTPNVGSSDVLVNGLGVVRLSDVQTNGSAPGMTYQASQGSATVFVNQQPAVCNGDSGSSVSTQGSGLGSFSGGSTVVNVG